MNNIELNNHQSRSAKNTLKRGALWNAFLSFDRLVGMGKRKSEAVSIYLVSAEQLEP
jgi:hypothetical protein